MVWFYGFVVDYGIEPVVGGFGLLWTIFTFVDAVLQLHGYYCGLSADIVIVGICAEPFDSGRRLMNRDNDKGKVLINRSLILGAGQLFLLLLLILRLYYLQVYQADKYKTLADENRISTRLLVPPRGVIYDRHGEMLATNRQNFQVMIVAEQTTNVQETLDALKKIMPLTEAEEEKVKKDLKKNRSFVPIKIKDNLTWEEVSQIQLNAPDLPGIIIDEGLSRYYPYGEKMAHVIGYVSSVGEKDLKDDPLL